MQFGFKNPKHRMTVNLQMKRWTNRVWMKNLNGLYDVYRITQIKEIDDVLMCDALLILSNKYVCY